LESYIVEVNNTEYEVTIRDNNRVKDSTENKDIKNKNSNLANKDVEETVKEDTLNKNNVEKNKSTLKQNKKLNNVKGVKVNAPMTGKILSIKVQKEDKVEKNEVIITLEAMKMETEIVSPVRGRVIEILTSEGSKCKQEDTLIIIEDGGS